MDELKLISDSAIEDAKLAIETERRSPLASRAWSAVDHAPWDNPSVACRQPRNAYLQAFAEYMTLHVRPPRNGEPLENAAAMGVMNYRLRSDITRVADNLPSPGGALFLERGESLKTRPDTWNQALRLRAEWIMALNSVLGELDRAAHGNPDFGPSYAAGLWTRMACDFAYDPRFVDRWTGNGGAAKTVREKAALELVQKLTAQP